VGRGEHPKQEEHDEDRVGLWRVHFVPVDAVRRVVLLRRAKAERAATHGRVREKGEAEG
jgi:hypothetical protein